MNEYFTCTLSLFDNRTLTIRAYIFKFIFCILKTINHDQVMCLSIFLFIKNKLFLWEKYDCHRHWLSKIFFHTNEVYLIMASWYWKKKSAMRNIFSWHCSSVVLYIFVLILWCYIIGTCIRTLSQLSSSRCETISYMKCKSYYKCPTRYK